MHTTMTMNNNNNNNNNNNKINSTEFKTI